MTKIYENDEKDKLLPISITTNFSLRTSRALFLFVIKRCLHLVFHRLNIQIAWSAFLVNKNPRSFDADVYRFKFLLRGSAILYSRVQHIHSFFSAAVSHVHFSMIVPFKAPIVRKGEAFRLWDFDRWSANDWALPTEIDVEIKRGEFDVFCHQAWNFTKNIVNFTFNSR
jgi:hypothetical protein